MLTHGQRVEEPLIHSGVIHSGTKDKEAHDSHGMVEELH